MISDEPPHRAGLFGSHVGRPQPVRDRQNNEAHVANSEAYPGPQLLLTGHEVPVEEFPGSAPEQHRQWTDKKVREGVIGQVWKHGPGEKVLPSCSLSHFSS